MQPFLSLIFQSLTVEVGHSSEDIVISMSLISLFVFAFFLMFVLHFIAVDIVVLIATVDVRRCARSCFSSFVYFFVLLT